MVIVLKFELVGIVIIYFGLLEKFEFMFVNYLRFVSRKCEQE